MKFYFSSRSVNIHPKRAIPSLDSLAIERFCFLKKKWIAFGDKVAKKSPVVRCSRRG
jgi:hypothetical protein